MTVVREAEFVGVLAPNTRVRREAAAAAVRAEWRQTTGQPSSETVYDYLKKKPRLAGGGRGASPYVVGDVAQARASARAHVRVGVSHSLHRARAARAARGGGGVDRRQADRVDRHAAALRRARRAGRGLRLPEDRVRVIVPDMGSAYGGKHTGEHAIEAARLAKAAQRAGQAGVDARGRVRLGATSGPPASSRSRARSTPTAGSWRGSSTTGTPARPPSGQPVRGRRTSTSSSIRAGRRCGRARIAAWLRRRTTTRARCTSTRLRGARRRRRRVPAAAPEGRAHACGARGRGRTHRAGRSASRIRPRARHRVRHGEGQLRRHGGGALAASKEGFKVERLVVVVRVRRDRQSRRLAQPDRGQRRPGTRRRAVRGDSVRRRPAAEWHAWPTIASRASPMFRRSTSSC